MKIELEPIGVIHSPYEKPSGVPIQSVYGRDKTAEVEIYPEFADGLSDIEGFDCIWLIWYGHLSKKYSLKVVPYMDDTERGVFATRAPSRPNPVCLSVAKLVEHRGNTLVIEGVDMIEGTPVIDIKPYIPGVDSQPACKKDGWLDGRRMGRLGDSRFGGEEPGD